MGKKTAQANYTFLINFKAEMLAKAVTKVGDWFLGILRGSLR